MHCLEIDIIKYIFLPSVIARKLNFQKLLLQNNAFLVMSLLYQTSNIYSYLHIYVLGDWTFRFFVVFTAIKIRICNLFYFTPYLNCYSRFHPSQLYKKGQIITFSSIIERKHYIRFTRLLKITLFSFERCLAIHKKICKEIETIASFKNFMFPSMIDNHISCVLCFGGYYA